VQQYKGAPGAQGTNTARVHERNVRSQDKRVRIATRKNTGMYKQNIRIFVPLKERKLLVFFSFLFFFFFFQEKIQIP
jgi:hypothetical protein